MKEHGSPAARWLGIDWGRRWIGVAASDPLGTMALPLEVCDGRTELLRVLSAYLDEHDVAGIVVGLPRNMDGSEGPGAERALELARTLQDHFGIAVTPWDERLTTVQAERSLREGGVGRRRAHVVDKVAAQIMLQSFLDARRAGS